MQTSARSHVLVSEDEFLALPESMERIELLDGEVIVAPSPTFWHQELAVRVLEALRSWAAAAPSPHMVCMSPLDVRFGPDRILQPDVFVLQGTLAADHSGPVDRIPLLCVEVLSGARVYDRVTKRAVYAAAGVPEYWVVWQNGTVETFSGEALAERAELVEGSLSSPRLPGFQLDLEKLFRKP